MHTLIPHTCPLYLFESVKQKVKELELDDRDMHPSEFFTMDRDNKLYAFGRIRRYDGFAEACSLGVIEEARNHGLAHKLMNALMETCQQPLYLVCVIPGFFASLGFSICEEYPEPIVKKLQYCRSALPAENDYVVMRRD